MVVFTRENREELGLQLHALLIKAALSFSVSVCIGFVSYVLRYGCYNEPVV